MGVYRLSAVDIVLEKSCGIQQDSISYLILPNQDFFIMLFANMSNASTSLDGSKSTIRY